ncbi:hypothetical protein Bbelb_425160 [Branchiostoma belcheri]|nr:hypothetical protein Bbelb_425160 [Branchiostoma belcheri]
MTKGQLTTYQPSIVSKAAKVQQMGIEDSLVVHQIINEATSLQFLARDENTVIPLRESYMYETHGERNLTAIKRANVIPTFKACSEDLGTASDNVLIREVGEKLAAKIIDFGIACYITRPIQLDIQPGERVSGHIAPEVSAGGPVTVYSDIFSLGRLVDDVSRSEGVASHRRKLNLVAKACLKPDHHRDRMQLGEIVKRDWNTLPQVIAETTEPDNFKKAVLLQLRTQSTPLMCV